jgi:hypothetical protein
MNWVSLKGWIQQYVVGQINLLPFNNVSSDPIKLIYVLSMVLITYIRMTVWERTKPGIQRVDLNKQAGSTVPLNRLY